MAVVRSLFGRFSKSDVNDLKTPANLVCLSDGDIVADEPLDTAVRYGPGDAPAQFSGLEVDQSLGQLITETREQRGLSREQVADETHIPAYYVRMIESDKYDAVPDQLYLLPFFRRYATYLGLDAQKVVSRFIHDFEQAENGVIETPVPATKAKALLMWRQVAILVLVSAVLLPLISRGIGIVRASLRLPADSSSSVAVAPNALPPSTILTTDAPRPATAQQPAETPPNPVASHAISTASAGPEIAPQPTPARHLRRRAHGHRLSRFARHSSHKATP